MKFPEGTPVAPAKIKELRERLAQLGINLAAVEESATRGSGPGGRNRNSTASVVTLRCPQFDVNVRAGDSRSRALNRFFALRRLAEAVERRKNGVGNVTEIEQNRQTKIRRQKSRRRRRSRSLPSDGE
jgi:protein subunit release factor B